MTKADGRTGLSILIPGAGKPARLGSEAKWRRAIELGDLAPDTVVEVTVNGEMRQCPASEVPELARLFEAVGALHRLQPSQPSPLMAQADRGSGAQDTEGVPSDSQPIAPSQLDARRSDPGEFPAAPASASHGRGNGASPPASSQSRLMGPLAAAVVFIVAISALVVVGDRLSTSDEPSALPSQTYVAPAPEEPASEILELGAVVSWDAGDDPASKTYQFDDMVLTITSRQDAAGDLVPVLSVHTGQGYRFELAGAAGRGPAAADFGVVQLAQDEPPQIFFSSFTGGAHCCTRGELVVRTERGFSRVALGDWDHGLAFRDIDGDSISEIVAADERFLYAFAPYAASVAPPKILALRNGAIVDVSADARFQDQFETALVSARQGCAEQNNGACAAYVAAAARLGRVDEAWAEMIRMFDPDDTWDYPTGCEQPVLNGACPSGSEIVHEHFPDALAAFLLETGYLSRSITQREAGPSFDCALADNNILRLICATPVLAEADRRLAASYNAAFSRSSQRDVLRRDQLAWIERRDSGLADPSAILDIYERRIAELDSGPRQ